MGKGDKYKKNEQFYKLHSHVKESRRVYFTIVPNSPIKPFGTIVKSTSKCLLSWLIVLTK